MANMDIMYRAYRELQQAMSKATSYSKMTDALSQADVGTDTHSGSTSLREIDMDWVKAIEKAIPYIDAAIREQRRFIVQQDEIVPIEKSRKITSESVRHLAQHTNLIARVEGDTVTPESILNIYREESFAIYENRFLRTLIKNASIFVEKRYKALCEVPNESVAHLEMNRTIRVSQEQIRVQLAYSTEYREATEVSISADVSGLSNFQRVLRIRKILADFIASPLMRELSGTEPVRPPITRTNLLTKNVNFREALELWVFLESYTKNGYYTVLSEANGNMMPDMQHGLYDILNLTRFVVRMNLSDSIRDGLEAEYQAENARRAAEAAKLEEERKRAEEKRLKKALEEQAAGYEAQLQDLKKQHEQEIQELNASRLAELAALRAAHSAELEAVRANHQKQLADLEEGYRKQIDAMQTAHAEAIRELTQTWEDKLAQAQREWQSAQLQLEEEHRRVLQQKEAEHAAAMTALGQEHTKALAEQKTAYEEKAAEYVSAMAALRQEQAKQLEEMQAVHDEKITAWETLYRQNQEEQERILQETQIKHSVAVETLQQQYTSHLDALKADYDGKMAAQEALHHQKYAAYVEKQEAEYRRCEEKWKRLLGDQEQRYGKDRQGWIKERSGLEAKAEKLRGELKEQKRKLSEQKRANRDALAEREREIRSLRAERDELDRRVEMLRQEMDELKAVTDRKIRQAERNRAFQIWRLEAKLKKALKKCPYPEVMAAGEEYASAAEDL